MPQACAKDFELSKNTSTDITGAIPQLFPLQPAAFLGIDQIGRRDLVKPRGPVGYGGNIASEYAAEDIWSTIKIPNSYRVLRIALYAVPKVHLMSVMRQTTADS